MTHSSRLRAIHLLMPALSWVVVVGLGMTSRAPFAQGPQNLWSGHAQCALSVQSAFYTYQETQTWTITGAPNSNGATVYPAIWSVAGQGQRQDTQGSQVTTTQWTTIVLPTVAPITIFVNSAHQLIIKSYHAQERVDAAVTGSRQVNLAGVTQPPVPISFAEFEWQFPVIEVEAAKTEVNGTSSTPINSSVGPMQPARLAGVANCEWHFVKGTTASSGTASPTQPTTPSQSVSLINPAVSALAPAPFPPLTGSSAGGTRPGSGATAPAAYPSASSGAKSPASAVSSLPGTAGSSRCQPTQRPRDPMLLGTLHAGKSISHAGKLMSAGESHFFQIKLPASVNLSISLGGIRSGSDFDLYVYRPDYAPINCSLTRGGADESVDAQLGQSQNSNVVIVEVRPFAWTAGSSAYVLKLSGVPDDKPSP